MKNGWLLLVGFFAGLWWSERQKNQMLVQQQPAGSAAPQPTAEARRDRTLEEMSEAYQSNPHPLKQLSAITEDRFVPYVKRLAAQLVKPDMTPLEAKLSADHLAAALISARGYDEMRKMLKDDQSEKWLQDVIDNEENADYEL